MGQAQINLTCILLRARYLLTVELETIVSNLITMYHRNYHVTLKSLRKSPSSYSGLGLLYCCISPKTGTFRSPDHQLSIERIGLSNADQLL